MGQGIQELTKQNLWKTAFQEHFKFFKGCPPHILLTPFLNTLTHILFSEVNKIEQFFC